MSTNSKYYYIKLKDSYFNQDNIQVLESLPNGYIYSLILVKIYVRSARNNGRLMMTPSIPYDPNNLDILAKVLGHDLDHVKEAIKNAIKLDLITIVDGSEIWVTEMQNLIGKSSTEGDRIRAYRQQLAPKSVQMYDKCTPEIELKLKKKKEIKEEKTKIFDFVYLTETEFNKLVKRYGQDETDHYLHKLNTYIGVIGEAKAKKKYKSHYHVVIKWHGEDKKK